MFPLMKEREFDDLVADIKKNGQRQPIDIYQGEIIDGRRNRGLPCN